MELIIKNADYSACGIGMSISNDVIRMMAKYSNYANNEDALQAVQKFINTVGSETIAKCTIIVPCFAANVTEAMKDLVTDTDLRSNTFDGAYYSITANKGLIATNEATSATIPYRTILAVNGGSDKYSGHLKMVAYSKQYARSLCAGSDGGYIKTESIMTNENGNTSLAGLTSTGLSINNNLITGFNRTKGIIGVLDNKTNGSKYSIIDATNVYSTTRASEEIQVAAYDTTYLCQLWNGTPNTDNPITMFVWGIGISDNEALVIRNAMYEFMVELGLNPA